MRRLTRNDYNEPGSFERIEVAALVYADADSEDDLAFHRAKMRLRKAVYDFLLRHPNAAAGVAQET